MAKLKCYKCMCLKNISSYDGKVNHSFRDYKADDRKSLPRITRRRLQEFINLFHLRMTHSWNGCAASPAAAFVQNGYTVAGAGIFSAARRMRSLRSRSAPLS